MTDDARPLVAVVLGDPAGIGPEIVAKSLALPETRQWCRPLVVGDARVAEAGISCAGVPLVVRRCTGVADLRGAADTLEILDLANATPGSFPLKQASLAAGRATMEALERAIRLAQAADVSAVTFAPLNKQAMHLAGNPFGDEHQLIAHWLGVTGCGEINVVDELWTSRVTSHIGLREVSQRLTADGVLGAIRLMHATLRRAGTAEPRIGVAALNPHGGEGGLFGPEEETVIAPAVKSAQGEDIQARGPFPADTIFVRARRGEFDGVVTMYHDQGQIALKFLGFDRAVTVLGGLPIPVTTPAHGTAFDIVGKGKADVGAFQAALQMAVRMARGTATL